MNRYYSSTDYEMNEQFDKLRKDKFTGVYYFEMMKTQFLNGQIDRMKDSFIFICDKYFRPFETVNFITLSDKRMEMIKILAQTVEEKKINIIDTIGKLCKAILTDEKTYIKECFIYRDATLLIAESLIEGISFNTLKLAMRLVGEAGFLANNVLEIYMVLCKEFSPNENIAYIINEAIICPASKFTCNNKCIFHNKGNTNLLVRMVDNGVKLEKFRGHLYWDYVNKIFTEKRKIICETLKFPMELNNIVLSYLFN
jgi:hypothetical protein